MFIYSSEFIQVFLRDVEPLEDIGVWVISGWGIEISGEAYAFFLVVIRLETIVSKNVANVVVSCRDQRFVRAIRLKLFLILRLLFCFFLLLGL